MNDKLILVAIAVSTLFIGAFFFALSLIYKAQEKKRLRFTNTFLFEVTPRFNEKYNFVNFLLFFGLTVCYFPYIYYVIYNMNTSSVTIMILSVILLFCLAALPFISLSKLREHYYLALGGLVCLLALLVMEGYYCFRMYRLYMDDMQLTAMIVAFSLAVLVLVAIFNPKLFDLKNQKTDSGTYKRKNFIFLAFTEWMLYPFMILSLVPMLLISLQ